MNHYKVRQNMKQKIISLAIIAVSLCSLNAVARDQSAKQLKSRAEKNISICAEKNVSACAETQDMKCHRPFEADSNIQRRLPKTSAMKGITLTADQQKKLDNLKEKNRKEAQKKREKRAKERKSQAEKMDKEMKKILTAGQYAIYQANKQQMKDEKAAGKPAGNGKRHASRPHDNKQRKSECCCPAPESPMPASGNAK